MVGDSARTDLHFRVYNISNVGLDVKKKKKRKKKWL